MTSDVLLRDVAEEDLPIFFEQQLYPDANWMAAFTAMNPTDRQALQCDHQYHRSRGEFHPEQSSNC